MRSFVSYVQNSSILQLGGADKVFAWYISHLEHQPSGGYKLNTTQI
jgi:hypothetical protein